MSRIIGGFILGALFTYTMLVIFKPPYQAFKCCYYQKGWEVELTENGLEIVCTQ